MTTIKTTDTDTIDRLFLELSQFTKATTYKEICLEAEVKRLRELLRYVAYLRMPLGDKVIEMLDPDRAKEIREALRVTP